MSEIRRAFHMVLPGDLQVLSYLFERAGYQLFVVGGAVRDAVMGVAPKDYDVATDATPDQVIELLRPALHWSVIEVGKAFGIVRANLSGMSKFEYEIATFRQDIGAGRRPDTVVFTTIEEDVKRRDLTINALFFDIQRQELVDLVGGLADIEARIVRTVGDPLERFAEDRLRVLRCLRFALKLGFSIHEETAQAILADGSLHGVSAERIREEFVKAVTGAKKGCDPVMMFDVYAMWEHVFPGMEVNVPLHAADIDTRDHVLLLARLLQLTKLAENGAVRVGKHLADLKYTAQEVLQVTFLLRFRDLRPETAYRMRKSFVSSRLTQCQLTEFIDLKGAVGMLQYVTPFIKYLSSPPVKGDDLKAQGYSGKELGGELERRETEIFRGLL
jgi:tRNA nucleotidyltransferase/poly(A) polymerase